MRFEISKFVALFVVLVLCGCQSTGDMRAKSNAPDLADDFETGADLTIRNNSLALLNELLSDEKNLSKILIIKRESPRLKRLVKEISETAAQGEKLLKEIAKDEPSINLKDTALPPGERATRQAISKVKGHELLHSKGPDFEFKLLLTQAEALNYGTYLAMMAAETEQDPTRARRLSELAVSLNRLYGEVLTMLQEAGSTPESRPRWNFFKR